VAAATKIATNLTFDKKLAGYSIHRKDREEIRLAAILHDVGHCALSHLSEPNVKMHQLFVKYAEDFRKSTGLKVKPHELMGYCIVKSPAFLGIFRDLVRKAAGTHAISDPDNSMTRIADMIVGFPPEGHRKQAFLSNIINGAFDADKIDYIARDSYFTGIALGAEVEMLIYKLLVYPIHVLDGVTNKDVEANSIIVTYAGGVAYEQVAMSKKSLNVNVYNHQKVMAAHEMARDLVHGILKGHIKVNGMKYDDPALFLNMTDWDLLGGSTSSDTAGLLQKRIAHRYLPRRALRVATHTLEPGTGPGLREFYRRLEDDERHGYRDFREAIAEIAGIDVSNIYVAVPKVPNTRELMEGKCIFPDGSVDDIGNHFAGAVESYGLRREVSYVYAMGTPVKKVADAAKQVLETEKYGSLRFRENATAGLDS
jgi:HD superfamily phosphohydrolase